MWQIGRADLVDLAIAVIAGLVASDGVSTSLFLQFIVPASPKIDNEPAHQGSASRAPRI